MNYGEFKRRGKIKYQGDHDCHIQFDDGVEGDIDYSEYLSKNPIFRSLEDLKLLSRASIEDDAISWPNRADIAPETLYEKLTDSLWPRGLVLVLAANRSVVPKIPVPKDEI